MYNFCHLQKSNDVIGCELGMQSCTKERAIPSTFELRMKERALNRQGAGDATVFNMLPLL